MNTSGTETILNGLIGQNDSTSARLDAVARYYEKADEQEKLLITLHLARVAITSSEVVKAISGK